MPTSASPKDILESNRYPLVGCPDASESGPAALATVLRYHGLPAKLRDVRLLAADAGETFDLTWVVLAARLLGLEGLPLSGEYDQLPEVERPNIVVLGDAGSVQRFNILFEIDAHSVVVGDPVSGRVEQLPRQAFIAQWTGDCVGVAPRPAELSRTREALARRGKFWISVREAVDPTRAGARKAILVALGIAVAIVVTRGPHTQVLSSWIGASALGAAALTSAWLALFGQSCRSCSAASRLAGVLPLDRVGVAFYGVAFVASARAGWEPTLALALSWASGVHAALLWVLWRGRASCAGCILVAAAALTAASAFSLASTGDGRLRLLSALVGMATMFAALPASRELATLLGDREARRLARSVADLGPPLTGAVRVTVWKVRGCPFCLYYESILRPGILEEFGEAIVLEEKEADYAWLPVPLIVVSGAVTIVFKSLPPEDEQGDRYHVLSAAVQAGGDQQFAALGRAGGLFVIDGRK